MTSANKVGIYARLSRDDGDKVDSDSIVNQLRMLEEYCARFDDLVVEDRYVDDGYTGTNFDRPAFKRMLDALEGGKINCVIVKDLSRFGRDYIDTGIYLERYFPAKGIRFIAVNDNIDSSRGAYDMMLPVKNIFNAQYSKDISDKIRSAFDTKRRQGQFIGAFCSYGYKKDPKDKNKLVIDSNAADIVRRVYSLFESGMGKDSIARLLNKESIPCPSEYKRLMGALYHNGIKLDQTSYWTYSTIDRMLANQMYTGDMVQSRYVRETIHGKAKKQDKENWIIAENTHEAIISKAQWNRVQHLLRYATRSVNFDAHANSLSGFLKCGDCGRSMVHRGKGANEYYCCGSYERYGSTVCSKHSTDKLKIESIVLDDLNHIIKEIGDVKALLSKMESKALSVKKKSDKEQLTLALERIQRLRKGIYEDYKDDIISKDDYIQYKADYDAKEKQLSAQIEQADDSARLESVFDELWVRNLLEHGRLTELDRITLAETIESILVFEDGHIEINYRFPNELAKIFSDQEKEDHK